MEPNRALLIQTKDALVAVDHGDPISAQALPMAQLRGFADAAAGGKKPGAALPEEAGPVDQRPSLPQQRQRAARYKHIGFRLRRQVPIGAKQRITGQISALDADLRDLSLIELPDQAASAAGAKIFCCFLQPKPQPKRDPGKGKLGASANGRKHFFILHR